MNNNKELNTAVVVKLPYDAFAHYVQERINYLENEKDELIEKIQLIDCYLDDEYEILDTLKAAYNPEKPKVKILGNLEDFIKRITN